jgi:trehalose 6-phosphate phosphatase
VERQVRGWADAEAAGSGLDVRAAKASVELHPPVATDKGTVIEGLADGLRTACYLADDLGDLPGYDGLDRLAARGVHAARVAVRGPETPPAVLDRADVVVDGPEGAVGLLRDLLAAAG